MNTIEAAHLAADLALVIKQAELDPSTAAAFGATGPLASGLYAGSEGVGQGLRTGGKSLLGAVIGGLVGAAPGGIMAFKNRRIQSQADMNRHMLYSILTALGSQAGASVGSAIGAGSSVKTLQQRKDMDDYKRKSESESKTDKPEEKSE